MAAKSEAVIDAVLVDAAEALIRNRARRPSWLPKGFPMKLILSLKRERLLNYIVGDNSLREYLRGANKHLTRPELLGGVTAENLDRAVRQSAAPHALIAAALCADDARLSAAAKSWAMTPQRILEVASPPAPAVRPTPTSSESEQTTRTADPVPGPQDDTTSAAPLRAVDSDQTTTAGAPSALGESAVEAVSVPCEEREELIRQRDSLLRRVEKLQAANEDLQSRLPSKGDRRRQNKRARDLEAALKREVALQELVDELGSERDRLVEIRGDLAQQVRDSDASRERAEIARRNLEARIDTTAGRAEYLRRSLRKDIDEVLNELECLETGKQRTRSQRRYSELVALLGALDNVFPPALTHKSQPSPIAPAGPVAVGPQRNLAVTPIGGGDHIGGSCILVEAGDVRLLVDAGIRQQEGGAPPEHIQDVFALDRLDAVIVTHAHNDHGGYVPAIVEHFGHVPVYCSAATAALLPTMWHDAATLMLRAFEEAEDGRSAPTPLYNAGAVEAAESQLDDRDLNRQFWIDDVRVTLFNAGHILGAVGVVLEVGDRKVVVTGDVSSPGDHLHSVEEIHLPDGLLADADLLVIETTYCHADHTPRSSREESLARAVRSTLDRRGRVLIPAFALGRAQEVAMVLSEHLPDVDVLIDGMARDITTIYETANELKGRTLNVYGSRVRAVENGQRWREMRTFTAGVVVATSGMLSGGPAVEWAKRILPDPHSALLLCGYQDEEAPGRKLENLMSHVGQRTIRLPDFELGWTPVDVRAQVHKYSLSAHADRTGLLEIIKRVRPRSTMLVHGERHTQQSFTEELRRQGFHTVLPGRWQAGR